MNIDRARLRAIAQEMIDDNPFAIRALLRIASVELSDAVPTAAVTCEDRPRLLVNAGFVAAHCRNEDQVKALLCHEFLHVLLRHTERRRPTTPARHLAQDAVINAIIHRTHGKAYSSLMAEYYAGARGLLRLLRPMNAHEHAEEHSLHRTGVVPQWARAWSGLYAGHLVADDIEALAQTLVKHPGKGDAGLFTLPAGDPWGVGDMLGNHDQTEAPLPERVREALDGALREMDGHGIWRSPDTRGVGANPYAALMTGANQPLKRWRMKTLALLRRYLTPDPRSRKREDTPTGYALPVLSPADRRAMLRSLWQPFLPEAQWQGTTPRHAGTTQVYLDVSGSMSHEMPILIALLGQLSCHIRRPFWAFSDVVAPAVIERGQLKAQTTGGTSMACVLRHVAQTRPAAAVVVTDGYIEAVDPKLVQAARGTRLHVLLTRDGSANQLQRAGIAYTQLDRVPQ